VAPGQVLSHKALELLVPMRTRRNPEKTKGYKMYGNNG
jgi:hypothetical protein